MDGLLFVVIIALWAAYLVPRWVSRHERRSEERNVERFSRAMRVLSRRGPGSVPGAGPTEPGDGPGRVTHGAHLMVPTPRTARARLAARRRRTLLALCVATVLTGALVLLTPLPGWVLLLAVAVLLGDLAHLRNQARQREALHRNRGTAARSADARHRRTSAVARMRAARHALTAEGRAAAEAELRRAEAEETDARAAQEALDAAAWQPLPVPLPTYVTKPKAVRPTRIIDLTGDGAWAVPSRRAPEPAPEALRPVEATIDLGEDLRRRAVGD